MKVPPTTGMRDAKRSTTSVEGVMGYPAANRDPAANAPSQQAWSPSMKCVPVRTPRGSAFTAHLRGRRRSLSIGTFQAGHSLPVDRKIRAVHPAQIAAAALFGRDYMGWMIALGIESGR